MSAARTQQETPFVSVVVPVFNDVAGIETALASLTAQSYPRGSYEIVVVDNGSTDATREAVNGHVEAGPDLVRLVREDRIQGSYAARNAGVRAARGDVLAFTDADCVPDPGWIAAGVGALADTGAPCGGGRIEFTFRSSRPNVFEYLDSARKLKQREYVENSGFAATANFFARRELFDRHGLFRDELVSGGDYEFGRRVTQRGEGMVYIPDALVLHPARSTFRQVYDKSKRVARGQRQLAGLGVSPTQGSLLRLLVPVAGVPGDPELAPPMSLLDRIEIVLLLNFVRWLNFFIRAG